MYAVIESGGKQYRVELGSEIEVDRLDVNPGDQIDIARVLLVADGDRSAIGRPVVEGAMVSANVVRQMRGDKIVVFKYKPKARTRVKNGHRAEQTVLRIADIAWDGRSAAKDRARIDAEQQRSAEEAREAAARQAAADQALAAQLAATRDAAAAATNEAAKPARRTRAKATTKGPDEASALEAAPADTSAQADTTPAAEPADQTAKDE